MSDDAPDGAGDPETPPDDANTPGGGSDTPTDGLDGATDDLRVAAVAAGCTVGLTLALRYGVGRDVAFGYRLLPLGPYFLSLFAGRLAPDDLDTPRTWSALTAAVTAGLFVYFGVL